MDVSFSFFCEQLFTNPILALSVCLTLGTVFVNGWTDAPNAIASCVTTRCISVRSAISMAAVFNFFGVLVMTLLNSSVAQTITKMVDLTSDPDISILALSAALLSIVLWAVVAWCFGIPTSESHALIAGLTGAALAVHEDLSAINAKEWLKVIYGLILSLSLGFALGLIICWLVSRIFSRTKRYLTEKIFRIAQTVSAAMTSFMHGAQDGQKFMGVIILSLYLSNGAAPESTVVLPVWLMLLCSVVMGVGTSVGGKRIIQSVGMDMVRLEKYQGFASDMATSVSLLFASVLGLPVSTTHVKTTAIMGAGAARRLSSVNISVVKELFLAWALTFPLCALIGFFVTKLFLFLFI